MACSGGNFVPKPRGMNHIELPVAEYQEFNVDSIPYSFSYSKHAEVINHNDAKIIDYKAFGAKVWLTYSRSLLFHCTSNRKNVAGIVD